MKKKGQGEGGGRKKENEAYGDFKSKDDEEKERSGKERKGKEKRGKEDERSERE